MASVIRVKRRIDEDPAEALILSCKRQRHAEGTEVEESDTASASVWSFAGTIKSKNEPVSRHIKDAIRKKKVHKELHAQTADFKHSLHIPQLTKKLRKETEQASRSNRYRVTWSRRALDLDCLDKDIEDCDDSNTEKNLCSPVKDGQENRTTCNNKSESLVVSKSEQNHQNKENSISDSSQKHSDGGDSVTASNSSTTNMILPQHTLTSSNANSDTNGACDSRSFMKEDKMFCIFDVESEKEEDPLQGVSQQSTSGITLNNVPMVSKRVGTPPPDESEFVYDLYYTHNNLTDLDVKAVLTVETLCEDLVNDQLEDGEDGDLVHDNSDDSNEENNWRNDYPDEDPRFFENEEEELYGYAEDMVDTNILTDDDGDLLAYWMDTRCRVDEDSDNDEDEYDKDGSSDEDSDES